MEAFVKRYNWLIVSALVLIGAAFLFKMAYLKFWISSPLCLLYLAAIHTYVKARFGVRISDGFARVSLAIGRARRVGQSARSLPKRVSLLSI